MFNLLDGSDARDALGNLAIDYQRNEKEFLDSLRAEFKKLRELDSVDGKDFRRSKVSEILFNRFKLTINLDVTSMANAYVWIPRVDKDNPMLDPSWADAIGSKSTEKIIRKTKAFRAAIDLENATFGGDISKIEHEIVIGSPLLEKGSPLSIDQVIAVLLHEVGHLGSYYEFMFRGIQTSIFLSDALHRLMGIKDKKQRQLIVDKLEDAHDINFDKGELVAAHTESAVQLVVISGAAKTQRQELGWDIYQSRAFEAAADQFASRMGLESALATGVVKLLKLGYYEAFSTAGYLVSLAFQITLDVLVAVSYGPIVILLLLLGGLTPIVGETYDRPKRRIEVIYKELLGRSKGVTNKKERARINEEAKGLKLILDKMNQYPGFNEALGGALLPFVRQAKRHSKAQHVLENLSVSGLIGSSLSLEQHI